jgi:hypothetical protein
MYYCSWPRHNLKKSCCLNIAPNSPPSSRSSAPRSLLLLSPVVDFLSILHRCLHNCRRISNIHPRPKIHPRRRSACTPQAPECPPAKNCPSKRQRRYQFLTQQTSTRGMHLAPHRPGTTPPIHRSDGRAPLPRRIWTHGWPLILFPSQQHLLAGPW